MHEHTTFARAPATGRQTGASLSLPPDLLEKSRRRVKILALLVLLGAGADLFVGLASLLAKTLGGGAPEAAEGTLSALLTLLSVALSLTLFLLARSARVRNVRLLDMALVFEVLICFLIAIGNPLSFYAETGALPLLTWVTPLIILFPLLVPCPPRRTLVTALLAAATRPLALLLLQAAGKVSASGEDYLSTSFGPALAVAFAFFGSRVVYGLGIEVAKARRLGSYHLERLLGRGGMGEVWLARHRLLARPAAVKLVRPELLGGTSRGEQDLVLQRFEREAQATAALRSPHTIGVYDFGIADDGTFYYVMELLEGFDADSLVRRFGPIPAARSIHFLGQICHSLAEAHEAGLIHRDIKPANLFVCRYGREVDFIKVLDFGLVKSGARSSGGDPGLTAENIITGTPAYMAPEQALGRERSDARSDLYAVGCVGYWLCTGHPVFEGGAPMEVLSQHLQTPPTPPSQRTEMPIPAALEELLLSCLAKEPAQRPQSATDLLEQLSDLATEHTWTREDALRWWERHQPPASVPSASET